MVPLIIPLMQAEAALSVAKADSANSTPVCAAVWDCRLARLAVVELIDRIVAAAIIATMIAPTNIKPITATSMNPSSWFVRRTVLMVGNTCSHLQIVEEV